VETPRLFDFEASFLVDIGLRPGSAETEERARASEFGGDDIAVGEAEVAPSLCWPGTGWVRSSVLGTYADMVCGGLAHRQTGLRSPLTMDLTLCWLQPVAVPAIVILGRLIKVGSSIIQSEAWFFGPDGGEPFAMAQLGFMASPRPQDTEIPIPVVGTGIVRPPMTIAFPEQLGCRVLEPGVVEVDLGPYVMNSAETIQGGIVALLGELAAETAAGAGQIATELDVRYLSAVRAGPGRATARVVGRSGGGAIVRVELRDPGNRDRLASVIMARTSSAPRRGIDPLDRVAG
jgi:acyl-coenzyme A thioesterase PaaI-like protein